MVVHTFRVGEALLTDVDLSSTMVNLSRMGISSRASFLNSVAPLHQTFSIAIQSCLFLLSCLNATPPSNRYPLACDKSEPVGSMILISLQGWLWRTRTGTTYWLELAFCKPAIFSPQWRWIRYRYRKKWGCDRTAPLLILILWGSWCFSQLQAGFVGIGGLDSFWWETQISGPGLAFGSSSLWCTLGLQRTKILLLSVYRSFTSFHYFILTNNKVFLNMKS